MSAARRVTSKARAAAPKEPVAAPPPPKPTHPAPVNAQRTADGANGMAAALEAFFRGAGLLAPKLDEKQADRLLHGLGQVMREVIVGISENLHVRTEHKNALRLPNTTIQPQANNPLKFSAGVEEALTNLLLRESSEYLPPVEAVREAFGDLKQHQQTLITSLRAAVANYVSRLDPDELENKYTNGKRGGLMSAANKLKYWDLYKDLYQLVTQAEPGQLPQQFLEEMARAYEQTASRNPRTPQAKAG